MANDDVVEGGVAPDFELPDAHGNGVRLSHYRGVRHVVLVFTRGFL